MAFGGGEFRGLCPLADQGLRGGPFHTSIWIMRLWGKTSPRLQYYLQGAGAGGLGA